MGIGFNPFTGQLDITGSSTAASTWTGSTATEAGLSVSGNSDGDAKVALDTDYIWVWDVTTSRWINQGIKAANAGATPNSQGYSLTYTNVASNRRELQLILQPADATNPGILTTSAQSIAGDKTFSGQIVANGGIDVTATGGSDSLNIGFTNADVINIGRSGATINLIGTTAYQNVTNYEVADKNITINKGGSAASATAAGLDVEEDSIITGYVNTSADRNSWELKAPNTAGVATVTPGAGGITLDQSSHNPVTIGTANGLSLSTQQLSLTAASSGVTGALTGTDWDTFNAKVAGPGSSTDNAVARFDSTTGKIIQNSGVIIDDTNNVSGIADLTATGTTTLAVALSGPLKASSGVVSAADIDLASEVTGVLPIANGGTNSSAVLNNNRIIQSASDAIVEAAAINANVALISDANGIPTHSTVTSTTLGYLDATSSVQTQLNARLVRSSGDIDETSFIAADNQVAAADVTAFAFNNAAVRSFSAIVSVARASTYAMYRLNAVQLSASWSMSQEFVGDDTGLTFTITNAGQVQYTSTSTGSTATVKFRALTTSV